MGKDRPAAALGDPDYVIPDMGEDGALKRPVIVPLRPDAEDPDVSVVGEAENVPVGRLRVDPARTLNTQRIP